jgi:hypothetical protein
MRLPRTRPTLALFLIMLFAVPAAIVADENPAGSFLEGIAPPSLPKKDLIVPEGWNGIPLLSQFELARERFPGAEVSFDTGEQEAGVSEPIPRLRDLKIEGQSELGLSPCSVTLRYAGDQNYLQSFTCEGPAMAVYAVLEEAFGEGDMTTSGIVYWMGKERAISYRLGTGIWGYFDIRLDKALQTALADQLNRNTAAAAAAEQGLRAGP